MTQKRQGLFWFILWFALIGWLGCSGKPLPEEGTFFPDVTFIPDGGDKNEPGKERSLPPKDASSSEESQVEPFFPESPKEKIVEEQNPDALPPEGPSEKRPPEKRSERVPPDSFQEGPVESPRENPATPEQKEYPLLRHWIGESCRQDADCDYTGGICLQEKAGYPGGHCTRSCTSTCPDQPGKPTTFCIADKTGQGHCVSQCEHTPCRTGYTCQTRSRIQQAWVLKKVCVPQSSTSAGPFNFLYIGDSQSSGSKFAKLIVDLLKFPGKYCSPATTTNNTVYSYAKVSSAARHWSQKSGSSKNWLCGATKVYVNGTAPQNTNGSQLCAGISGVSKSIFSRLIDKHQSNAFVIQLGDNSLGFAESYVKSKIKDMLDQMPAGSLCFWVAPTYGKKYLSAKKNMEKWLGETLKNYGRFPCYLLTSLDELSKQTTCSNFNTGDGLHMTNCGSELWGKFIITKICALGKL